MHVDARLLDSLNSSMGNFGDGEDAYMMSFLDPCAQENMLPELFFDEIMLDCKALLYLGNMEQPLIKPQNDVQFYLFLQCIATY